MDFETDAQKECYTRVSDWLARQFEDSLFVDEDIPGFRVRKGSAIVNVRVYKYKWLTDDALIAIRSCVVRSAELTDSLMLFLLQKSSPEIFGAFSVDDDGDIFFERAMLGSFCDSKEFELSITAVANVADEYDDIIRSRWGGLRGLD